MYGSLSSSVQGSSGHLVWPRFSFIFLRSVIARPIFRVHFFLSFFRLSAQSSRLSAFVLRKTVPMRGLMLSGGYSIQRKLVQLGMTPSCSENKIFVVPC